MLTVLAAGWKLSCVSQAGKACITKKNVLLRWVLTKGVLVSAILSYGESVGLRGKLRVTAQICAARREE
jgi:hypothetical protein